MRLIDYDKIKSNLIDILKNNDIIWVVKDNAYGLGIDNMLSIGVGLGVLFYAVKDIEEGIYIKEKYPMVDVLVLGRCKDIKKLKEYNLIGTINDYDEYVKYKEIKARAHLAIDCGMNRFGMKRAYLAVINDKIVEAIYTHIYSSDVVYDKIRFIEELANKYNKKVHIGGSIVYKKTRSMIRIGKIIYDGAISLFGHIINIKKVLKGESVGYDGIFKASKDCLIGVCDVGYVNGLNILYNGNVVINGRYYCVVGKVCMDQCFVLVDDFVSLGDEVEFFGLNISEDEFIVKNNMTKYELLLQIK